MEPLHPLRRRSDRSGEPAGNAVKIVRAIGVSAKDPFCNRMLAALPGEDWRRIQRSLEPLPLPLGWAVHDAGRPRAHLYFITQGVVSRVCVTKDGKSAEFATTGSEGVVGVSLCLGGGNSSSKSVVVVEGFAYRLAADLLMRELGMHAQLLKLLLRHIQSVMIETGQIATCSRHHPLHSRLCRWLLSLLDRISGSRLPLTHEVIAFLLGVRREAATHELGKLQQEDLICCHRGHLDVLDRTGLEARACECYWVIKRAHGFLGAGSPTHVPA